MGSRRSCILTAGSAEPGVNGSCSGMACVSMYVFLHTFMHMRSDRASEE